MIKQRLFAHFVNKITLSFPLSLRVLLAGALCLSFNQASGNVDNVRFTPFETDERTSIAAVSSIHQDSSGYMWFGTQEGINRYNGYEIEFFVQDNDSSSGIASSRVNKIVEDDRGNIWIATYEGLAVYSSKTQQFSTYTQQSHPNVIGGSIIDELIKTIDGDLWFVTESGVSKFDDSKQAFKNYSNQLAALGNPRVWSLASDLAGGVWMGTRERGLLYYNPTTDAITQMPLNVGDDINDISINFLKFGPDQVLYVGTSTRKLFTLDIKQSIRESQELITQQLPEFENRIVRDLIVAKNGVTWIATNEGLFYKEPASNQFGVLTHNPNNRFSLMDNNIFDVYLDKSNVLWVATSRGLNRWNVNTSRFDHYRVNGEGQYDLSNPNITSISQLNEDILFVANYEGLDIINQKKRTVTTLNAIENNTNSLASNRVMAVYADTKNSIWFGYFANGLSQYDLETGTFKHYKHDENDPTSIGKNAITSIVKDSKGRLWFGTFNGGLSLYMPDTDSFKTYRHDSEDIHSISSNRIVSIYEDSYGLLWLGTINSGVNIFNADTEVALRVKKIPDDMESLSSNSVLSVLEDDNKNVWIGTHGGGLNLLKFEDRDVGKLRFTRFNRGQGLLSDVVYGALSDNEGNIWFSSNKGISKLNITTFDITNFNTSHGLQGNEFNSGAYTANTEGKLYFGGSNGVTAFYPLDIQPNPNKPSVILTAFNRLNQREKLSKSEGVYQPVEIFHTDYLLSFEFVALDYAAPQFNNYAYKLEGFDNEWILARSSKQATYTNLPAGTYTFRVKASNSDGVWNEEGVSIDVMVLPPPWQTWWAYLSYVFVFGMICFLVFRQRNRKALRKARYLQELEENVRARTSELSEANKKLHVVSTTDQLTGLNNRLYLNENIQNKCDEVVDKCKSLLHKGTLDVFEQDGPRLCCIMLDLDGFKPINDNYGHSAGDKVIVEVARLLRDICQNDDIVVRWGGDEFIIISHIEKLVEIENLVEQIRKSIAAYKFSVRTEKSVKVSSSIGFAFYPFSYQNLNSLSWDQVHTLADKALYLSKEAGRNTWTGIIDKHDGRTLEHTNFVGNDIIESEKRGHISILRPRSVRRTGRTYES